MKALTEHSEPENFAVVTVFTICMASGIAVGTLLGWHCYLVATNQTTVEFYVNMHEKRDAIERGEVYKNPFDNGWKKNLGRVFGDDSQLLVLKILIPNFSPPSEPQYPDFPPRTREYFSP